MNEILQCFFRAFDDNLDTIFTIAHPSGEVVSMRQTMNERTKADALDHSADANGVRADHPSKCCEPTLQQEKIKADEDQQESVYSQHNGGGENGDQPSRKQIAHGHTAAESDVIDAHHAAAHFVGGDQLDQRAYGGEDGHHGSTG